eukprot:754989-Hanusia_phi.AAC.3
MKASMPSDRILSMFSCASGAVLKLIPSSPGGGRDVVRVLRYAQHARLSCSRGLDELPHAHGALAGGRIMPFGGEGVCGRGGGDDPVG